MHDISLYEYGLYYYELGYYDKSCENPSYAKSEKTDQDTITLSSKILQRYVGTFFIQGDRSQSLTVSLKDNRLSMVVQNAATISFFSNTETTFFDSLNIKYEFSLNPQTKKYDLTIITSGGLKIEVERIR